MRERFDREKKIKAVPYAMKIWLDKRSRHLHRRDKRYQGKAQPSGEPNKKFADFPDIWTAPEIFCLTTEARTTFLKSLESLRHKIGVLEEDVTLDFTATSKLYAEGMLLFYAELKRLIRLTKGKVNIGCILPTNSKVGQVLKQLGVLGLLGVKEDIVPVDEDVVNWRAASGYRVLGEKYEDILQQYDGEIASFLQANLYTGITEAMTNVLNHAYDLPRGDGIPVAEEHRYWWMFSHERDGLLSVVFCDLGAGIPRTLPLKRRGVWNRLLRKGLKSDAEIIKFAVKDSVSRTRKSHRGKGLRQIVEVINGVAGAEAAVYSNSGSVAMRSGGGARLREYSSSILGTLIYWSIPLQEREVV